MSGNVPSGDMYGKYFPGEPFVLDFTPTAQQVAAVTALAEQRAADDLLPMLLGDGGLVEVDR